MIIISINNYWTPMIGQKLLKNSNLIKCIWYIEYPFIYSSALCSKSPTLTNSSFQLLFEPSFSKYFLHGKFQLWIGVKMTRIEKSMTLGTGTLVNYILKGFLIQESFFFFQMKNGGWARMKTMEILDIQE